MRAPLLNETITEAVAADYPSMAALIARCLREVNAPDYPADVIEYLVNLHSAERIEAYLNNRYTIVLKIAGEIVGIGALNESEITTVFVLPDNHLHGIGKRIMAALEKEAYQRGLKCVELHSSITAVHFYEKLGYSHIKEEVREGRGVNYHMSKNLP